jgi:GNAT superfamily N-acetyltransferase
MPAQRLAHEMARLFMWEEHYDFPLFYAQHGRHSRRPTAYLALLHSRAIGLAVVTEVDRWGWWHKADREGVIHFDERSPAIMVAGIFVCANYRRAGVARWLIAEVAQREGVPVRELVWQPPFSKAGHALALAMAGEMALRIG